MTEKTITEAELKSELEEREKEIKELKEQLYLRDIELRKVAMDLILQMEDTSLDKAILDKNPEFKLPTFPRAQIGDPDYPDSTHPKRSILTFPKRRLVSRDIDNNISNYASVYRGMLRWMSEEDFKKMCYLDD